MEADSTLNNIDSFINETEKYRLKIENEIPENSPEHPNFAENILQEEIEHQNQESTNLEQSIQDIKNIYRPRSGIDGRRTPSPMVTERDVKITSLPNFKIHSQARELGRSFLPPIIPEIRQDRTSRMRMEEQTFDEVQNHPAAALTQFQQSRILRQKYSRKNFSSRILDQDNTLWNTT